MSDKKPELAMAILEAADSGGSKDDDGDDSSSGFDSAVDDMAAAFESGDRELLGAALKSAIEIVKNS